jgi:hypothetical protein
MGSDYSVIITDLVMAFPKLSTTHKYTINPRTEGFDNEQGIHPAGTHDPDHPDIGWVLETGNACRISCRIAAPVTEKTHYVWFKWSLVCHFSINPLL